MRANRHPAVGLWLVGNEVNLPVNRFLCEEQGFCKFRDDVEAAFTVRPPSPPRARRARPTPPNGARARPTQVLNELCGVVDPTARKRRGRRRLPSLWRLSRVGDG